MKLIENITNSEQLKGMFLDGLNLDDIKLSVVLFDAGPSVTFKFVLNPLCSSSPQKWKAKGFNNFDFCLKFFDVSDVVIRGWSSLMICSPVVTFDEGKYHILIKSQEDLDVTMSCSSEFLYLDGVRAYRDDGF
jgi:hypothetical protein